MVYPELSWEAQKAECVAATSRPLFASGELRGDFGATRGQEARRAPNMQERAELTAKGQNRPELCAKKDNRLPDGRMNAMLQRGHGSGRGETKGGFERRYKEIWGEKA